MRFFFSGARRRRELDELRARIRSLTEEILRIEQSVGQPTGQDEAGDAYRSVQRLREIMLQDDLASRKSELRVLETRAAQLEAQLPRQRRPAEPATPAAHLDQAKVAVHRPATGSDVDQPPHAAAPALERPAALPPTAAASEPPTRAQPTLPEVHPPSADMHAPVPPRREIETAVGGPAVRWLLIGTAAVSLAAWIAGALFWTGILGPDSFTAIARQNATAGIPHPPAVSAPTPVASPIPAAAVAPTSPPTSAGPSAASSPTMAPASATASPPQRGGIAAPPPAGVRPPGIATILAPSGYTGALLRAEPSLQARSQRFLPNGTAVEVLDGSASADRYVWSRVRTDDGTTGWIVSDTIP